MEGIPVIVRTLHAFEQALEWDGIVLVLHEEHFGIWERIVEKHPIGATIQLVKGGEERSGSVSNGAEKVPDRDDAIIAVHDAVRPFIRPERIQRLMEEAGKYGNAVPSLPLKESLRRVERDGTNEAVDRSAFRTVQTPQCFAASTLKEALNSPYRAGSTDEASLVDTNGTSIHLAEGDPENIKITDQLDFRIGRSLVRG